MSGAAARLHVGTSGWHYDHWCGPFYPQGMASGSFLAHYSEHLPSVELNNTFYQLPDKESVAQWREQTPAGFTFAVKASRYITHMKKLKDPDQGVPNFLEAVAPLGDQMGPILFQLPPRWHFNPERLAAFLDYLPADRRYAFEFRDPSWFDDRAYDLLARHGAAFCIYHMHDCASPREITADFIYVRLHGTTGTYQGGYSARQLSGWAGAFSAWLDQGKDIFCYFNNDESGRAPRDAQQLQQMLD
jgi:uncharacterized protein YecE (DUF72 family)